MSRLVRSAGVGVVDQGVYSLGNILLVLTLARVASPTEFGAFALLMTGYETLQLVTRGVVIQPMALLEAAERDRHLDGAVGLGLAVGTGFTVLALVPLVSTMPHSLSPSIILVALSFGPLLMLEVIRAAAFAADRGTLALLLDSTWTFIQILVVGLSLIVGSLTPLLAAAGWASGCCVAGAVGLGLLRRRPRLGSMSRHVRQVRAFAGGLTKDNVLSAVQTHSFNWLVAALLGIVALGQLRVLRALFGIATVAAAGLRVALTPLARRAWIDGALRRHRRILAVLAVTLAALVVVSYGLLALFGVASVLGLESRSNGFGDLLLPFAARQLAVTTTIVGVVAISSTGFTSALVRPRLVTSMCSVLFSLIGLFAGSVEAALLWSAAGTLVGAPVWWWTLQRIRHTSGAPVGVASQPAP